MSQYMLSHNVKPQIGTAWHGKHIVVINCNSFTNHILSIHKSLNAPIEPPHVTCVETLSRFFSIGYQLVAAIPLSNHEIQYLLVK
jgi:hypothetical protein